MAPQLQEKVLQQVLERTTEGDKSSHLDSRVTVIPLQESWDMHGEVLRCPHIITNARVNDHALWLCLGVRDIQVIADHANSTLSLFNLG
jgi:hypothetical protein